MFPAVPMVTEMEAPGVTVKLPEFMYPPPPPLIPAAFAPAPKIRMDTWVTPSGTIQVVEKVIISVIKFSIVPVFKVPVSS